jgi:hypothetical protein
MPCPGDSNATVVRRRLGIPEDARRVLVFTESSHWDPDWMLTSDQYFRFGVRRTLDQVLDELDREPRRIWSADCVFFLAMYWDRVPAQRQRLAAHVNSGRLRLTSSGVTTQDTLLPSTESILRDFLIGQEWLRVRGMNQEPRLACFPDSFGHSPALPSLLRAAGFDRTIVTRIDGSYFVGADWESSRRFPRPGSSAETLTRAGSADFVWRDRSGAEVLAHWHPFTYGQGDMLAAVGPLRYMSLPIAVPDRSERRVAARIERYAAALEPLARTPYLLCPIGLDFVNPIRGLLDLLDRYNRKRYPDSGLWVVNAGADDYLELVDAHRPDLPVVELDPNPYWTGFYASRPELKRAHRRLVDTLGAAEAEAVAESANGEPVIAEKTAAALADAWWTAATANHHDFVTGTSPDRVVRNEQEPWLRSALAQVERVAAALPTSLRTFSRTRLPNVVTCAWEGGVLCVRSDVLEAVIDPARGGCVTQVDVGGRRVLDGVGTDLVAYHDEGGLWRMGGEYRGGRFVEVDRASGRTAEVTTCDLPEGGVEVVVDGDVDGLPARRRLRFAPGDAGIGIEVYSRAGDRRTVTLALPAPGPVRGLVMDQPGGLVLRPRVRNFEPTFWPVSSWCVTDGGAGRDGDEQAGSRLALAVEMSRAVAASRRGVVEVVVARNAIKERAFRVLPIPACPARGYERGETVARLAVWWPARVAEVDLGREAQARIVDVQRERLRAAAARLIVIEDVEGGDAAAQVLALKPATRGKGFVVRLFDPCAAAGPRELRLRTMLPTARAAICDARERDIEELEVRQVPPDGTEIRMPVRGSITSVRLMPGE